ncbi:hypothetical protein TorRG33x02_341810 [Trema orientale]|uniref:Uncharacterized protein n=1 Tax=Trema orientale TaxID=63057 RepID=A0A2P5AT54_TREOI|nr:hypothetical protein TorRG33x02_341810 [Trema orientale]
MQPSSYFTPQIRNSPQKTSRELELFLGFPPKPKPTPFNKIPSYPLTKARTSTSRIIHKMQEEVFYSNHRLPITHKRVDQTCKAKILKAQPSTWVNPSTPIKSNRLRKPT